MNFIKKTINPFNEIISSEVIDLTYLDNLNDCDEEKDEVFMLRYFDKLPVFYDKFE